MLIKEFRIYWLNLKIIFMKTVNLVEFLPAVTYYFGQWGIHSQKSLTVSWLRWLFRFEKINNPYKSRR